MFSSTTRRTHLRTRRIQPQSATGAGHARKISWTRCWATAARHARPADIDGRRTHGIGEQMRASRQGTAIARTPSIPYALDALAPGGRRADLRRSKARDELRRKARHSGARTSCSGVLARQERSVLPARPRAVVQAPCGPAPQTLDECARVLTEHVSERGVSHQRRPITCASSATYCHAETTSPEAAAERWRRPRSPSFEFLDRGGRVHQSHERGACIRHDAGERSPAVGRTLDPLRTDGLERRERTEAGPDMPALLSRARIPSPTGAPWGLSLIVAAVAVHGMASGPDVVRWCFSCGGHCSRGKLLVAAGVHWRCNDASAPSLASTGAVPAVSRRRYRSAGLDGAPAQPDECEGLVDPGSRCTASYDIKYTESSTKRVGASSTRGEQRWSEGYQEAATVAPRLRPTAQLARPSPASNR